jgi:hypothetical protein
MLFKMTQPLNFIDLTGWLHDNVGKVLWSRPVLEARGEGWHVKLVDTGTYHFVTEVDIADPQKSLLFSLTWC